MAGESAASPARLDAERRRNQTQSRSSDPRGAYTVFAASDVTTDPGARPFSRSLTEYSLSAALNSHPGDLGDDKAEDYFRERSR